MEITKQESLKLAAQQLVEMKAEAENWAYGPQSTTVAYADAHRLAEMLVDNWEYVHKESLETTICGVLMGWTSVGYLKSHQIVAPRVMTLKLSLRDAYVKQLAETDPVA